MGLFRKAARKAISGKVVVFGSTTAIGQHLSLLLKLCPHVKELRCCGPFRSTAVDMNGPPVRGLVADLLHIDTCCSVKPASEPWEWEEAVRDAQLVLVCCGGRIVDSGRSDHVAAIAQAAPELTIVMETVAKVAPGVIIGIVSTLVNSLVPFAREVLVRCGAFDPRKLFGVTTHDVMRARVLVARELQMNPFDVNVPVVGGGGGPTSCPLITQTGLRIAHDNIVRLCTQVQSSKFTYADVSAGGGAALNTAGGDSPETMELCGLSHAYSVLEWSVSILKALRGDQGIIECSLVESSLRKETPFFSSRVELGDEGVARILPLGPMTAFEEGMIEAAVPLIANDVEAGLLAASTTDNKTT
ncbi:lactate malate dehydrogenase NAD binding domain [Trypanosoma vivax]|uniref:malate dehydrogenase n=1 Tax=Trypanosoma vivax (strain Y486) TaxID=1055687 RepID=G0U5Q3_TRYVY|nr:putative malate dehydrogenase [Trypanosoma vivax]KAH8608064.1 lactate malate dehydrogenase NAD binding domain [Trypanosoma vivax]CCC51204.1 putative malate dehydrogenase [Trypanosoma vivax Y486]